MAVLAVGLSYRGASLDLLERLAFTGDTLQKGLHHLSASEQIHESVILSTCNRVEIYAAVSGYHTGVSSLRQFLTDVHHVDPEIFAGKMYTLYEEDAIQHLFSVAAGIDSMVLGEPQILAQVRQAFRVASQEDAAGPLLSALFRHASRVGRRARSETQIGTSGATYALTGARLAETELGGLTGRTVLIIGAGKMSDLAAREMARKGASIIVANRTPSRARRLAHRTGGTCADMSGLDSALEKADLVISSTGARDPIVTVELLEPVMQRRRNRPLKVLDLAVPRDVAPECGAIAGVTVRDLDSLRDSLAPTPEQLGEVTAVRDIVSQETPKFIAWQRAHRLAPLMQVLQRRAEDVRIRELERAAVKLAALSPAERDAVDSLTKAIVAKLLHRPVTAVKAAAGSADGEALARALNELFGLES